MLIHIKKDTFYIWKILYLKINKYPIVVPYLSKIWGLLKSDHWD